MRIRGCVLVGTLIIATEHQYRNPRRAAGKLGHKGGSGKPWHVQCYHYQSQIASKSRLVNQDESLSRTRRAYHSLIYGFKSCGTRICLKWIVIYQ